MRERPLEIKLMVLFFLGLGLSFPFQIVWLYELQFSELGQVFHMLTPLNYLIMVACAFCMFAWKDLRRMTLIVSPLMLLLVLINNYYVGKVGYDYTMAQTTLASLAFISMHLVFFREHVQLGLKNPEKRWWLQSLRKQAHVPMEVYTLRSEKKKQFYTTNLSETGALISAVSLIESEGLSEGDYLDLRMPVGELRHIHAQAQVVRKANEIDGKKTAYGIEFVNMDSSNEKDYRRFYNQLTMNQ